MPYYGRYSSTKDHMDHSDIITNATWDLSRIHTQLPPSTRQLIEEVEISIDTEDKRVWKGNTRGIPTSKVFFQFLQLICQRAPPEILTLVLDLEAKRSPETSILYVVGGPWKAIH